MTAPHHGHQLWLEDESLHPHPSDAPQASCLWSSGPSWMTVSDWRAGLWFSPLLQAARVTDKGRRGGCGL